MSMIETRGHQMFPVLDAGQIETAKRFASGPAREFAPGEIVFDVGERQAPAWLVLKGTHRSDPSRRPSAPGLRSPRITSDNSPAKLSQLAGRQSLASGRAGADGATAIPFDAAHVRALMIGSAEIGEIMMRAFILRRVGLIEEGWRRLGADRHAGHARSCAARGLSRPQRLSLQGARPGD